MRRLANGCWSTTFKVAKFPRDDFPLPPMRTPGSI